MDPNTPYRSICHSFDARKLLPVSGKPEVLISVVGRSSKRFYAGPQATVGGQKCKNRQKRSPKATSGHTGSRNMAEMAKMNSQLCTSYSTSYTLWGLTRRYRAVLRGDLITGPIINGVGLSHAYRTLRQIQGRVTIFRGDPVVICFQLSMAVVALNQTRYKQSLHVQNVARQMAPLSTKIRIFATLSPPVQKLGDSWYPVPIPSILLLWSLKPGIKKIRAAVTSFEFTLERRGT